MQNYVRAFTLLRATVVSLFLAALVPTVRGDGFIVIHNPPPVMVPGHFQFAPLEVTYHHVTVEIHDHIATTTVEQDFYNPNSQRLEGTYLFPLPEGSHIDKFSMDIGGKMTDAELLPADKARALYEEIVRKTRDPALLEYAGRDAFQVHIFPFEPNSHKPVKLQYTQLLKSDSGLTEYVYPLNTEKFSARPLKDVSLKVSLDCKDPLKSIYSPSHNVEIKRDGDTRAIVGFEAHDIRPDTDFKLIFSQTDKPVGLDLLTYKHGSDDGYFLLLASPGMETPKGNVQKKDLCFIIDTSGSMSENGGKKIEQAKKALSFCLQNMNEGDRFEIIRFSTEAEPFFEKLVDADQDHIKKAQEFVSQMKPIGGTAISEALGKAFELRRAAGAGTAERPYDIIFITDGQPTIGDTSEDSIVTTVAKADGGASTRIFSFGLGTDVNTHLLDRLSHETRGFSQYVLPDEDLEVKLSSFYTKIKEPVLTDVKLAFTGPDIKASQLYPGEMPDLFKGEELIVFGRYSGHGAGAVKITGTLNGEKHEFTQDVHFADEDTRDAFIPRLWASRRVGYLLDQIRLHGESKELKDEVTRLAREHGIVTPYTAYLILEDEQKRGVPLAMQSFRELEKDGVVSKAARARYNSTLAEAKDENSRAGESAIANARDLDLLRQQTNLQQSAQGQQQLEKAADAPQAGPVASGGAGARAWADPRLGSTPTPTAAPAGSVASSPAAPASPGERSAATYGYRANQNYGQQARVVNGRAFYQNGNTWTDSTAQSAQSHDQQLNQKTIQFNSDEYFALLKKHPEAAQWLALGNEVDVVLDDTLYSIR
jgi:Ca-activated chloride channel family protein